MRAGRLRDLITIEKPIETRDAHGEVQVEWEAVATVRAGIFPVQVNQTVGVSSGKEYFDLHAQNREVNFRVELRYIKGITAAMRIKDELTDGRYLDIVIPQDVQNLHRDLHLYCIERLSIGS